MIFLITGTSRGIGRKITEYYLNKNHTVIGCSRTSSDIEHPGYIHFELSITDDDKVISMFRNIRNRFSGLDILINNAGIASMNHSLLTPMQTVRNILATNVTANFLFSRESVKIMKKKNWGRIINFATFAVPFKLEGEAAYAASKAAVISMTEILSREYAEFGVTVNAVAPPAVQTDLIKGVNQEKLNRLLKRQSISRYGTPEEICNVIDFLIRPESEMVNGQVIYMGGV